MSLVLERRLDERLSLTIKFPFIFLLGRLELHGILGVWSLKASDK